MNPYFRITLLLTLVLAACGDDDDGKSTSVADAGTPVEAGPTDDAGSPAPVDAGAEAATTDDCALATAGLAQTADANAPVLDASKSSLVRVSSNDTFCAGHDSGKHPAYGPFGYQLSVASSDADGDGRTQLDDVQADGAVRLASAPDIAIATRTDRMHFSTGGPAILIQLCLDKVYAPSELAIGVDLSDKAGHRSKAICIRQQSGG